MDKADIKVLIKQRATFKTKVTQFLTYLNPLNSCPNLNRLQVSELNIRLTKIEEIYSDYDSVQSDIENICEISEEQYAEREAFETRYFGAVALAREVLARSGNSAGPALDSRSVGSFSPHSITFFDWTNRHVAPISPGPRIYCHKYLIAVHAHPTAEDPFLESIL
ncbi:uncharacterized protein LOC125229208 [Leguminivora glycinivorella]|uniref:uncharacterized protein LOC125229208 n=1 Tax=Leguminivora glycinivorella TaxID=1035111 RepID=UPI0020103699|nr:uncharacterized protein LOC125229208 [Leguminivora glycinivorella]XP_047989960.1 uncharacterized protein LOC125229208 [Leguminivora glycinivorella]